MEVLFIEYRRSLYFTLTSYLVLEVGSDWSRLFLFIFYLTFWAIRSFTDNSTVPWRLIF